MSESGTSSAAEAESWFDREERLRSEHESGPAGEPEPEPEHGDEAADAIEPDPEGPADPQQWIDQLIQELHRAEQGSFGSGPRDALMARIKLAQAYSELGDSVSAAPLAVENAAQAEELFPSSEGMLAQLREFRDAACEAAGWTAAMMRTPEPEPEPVVPVPEAPPSEPMLIDELVEQAVPFSSEVDAGGSEAREPSEPADSEHTIPGPWTADSQGVVETPSGLAIAEPPPIEDAEEVLPPQPAGPMDLAAYEEIIRLRYELRDAQRTIDRLRHTNRKLREALEYEPE